ncbi:putative immunodominant antigen, putative,tc40 antigen-like [Trypanosoma grayi]|uniref:putative immunodominant antigen, putative,tc40 antigen-like n=1 Tax=Trypanosoma grayi TaxID=71804 RepID=UPI0004F47B4F|nr:putative immunodominant antigen, putative,tc40 antigen-like [Trypanosoma grayi]KEG10348.1 putative immunodominant antigen, putative,tc40 antigen-like [Trypanosoma grayi]
MTVAVDLFSQAKSHSSEGHLWAADAATFMEVPETPRVLADSQCYLAYTMKKRHVLRVVQRADLKKGTVRLHTTPIHAVRFVNYRSNVAASAGEGEFFVWVVTDEEECSTGKPSTDARLTVKVYFKLQDPITIPCFAFFINAESKRPDLLMLYDTQASILESSALIARYGGEPLEATLERNGRTLRTLSRAAGEGSLCSVGSDGWFAFTTGPTMVAACTLQNRSTPSWLVTEGEPVTALHLLDTAKEETTAILVAASAQAVYQWSLTGVAEPSLLRKFVVHGSIVAMESSRESFAVFDDKQQLALVTMQSPNNFTCTHYAMPCQVRRGGICFNRVGESSCVLADKSDRLTVFHLKASSSSAAAGEQGKVQEQEQEQEQQQVSKPAPVVTTAPAATTVTKNSEHRTGNSIIANLVNQLGLRGSPSNPAAAAAAASAEMAAAVVTAPAAPQRSSPYGHSSRPVTAGLAATGGSSTSPSSATAAAATAITDALAASTGEGAAAPVTRPALHNATLPQAPTDGVLAAAVHQSEDEVREALEQLESAMANTAQILQLVPETVRRDHEQLLNLSLEAQMTELQQTLHTTLPQQQATGGARTSVFGTYAIMMIMDSLSRNIAKGVTRGVEEAMTLHLDHEVRHAIGNRVRNTQKQTIKNRLDELLKESTSQFASQVEQTVQSLVKRELAEVLGGINTSLTTLVNENSRLQEELQSIMSSGVVEELRHTREELRTLRESVSNQQAMSAGAAASLHATSAFQGQRPTPETILSTAQLFMREQQKYRQGLEYLLLVNQAPLLLKFLTTLNREHEGTYSELIEDAATPNEVWCQVLLQLVEAATTTEEKESVVSVAIDILSERERLLQSGAQAAKVAAAMRAFGRQARAEATSASFLQCLKNLEKLLQ